MKMIMTFNPASKTPFNITGRKKNEYFKIKNKEGKIGEKVASNVIKTIVQKNLKEEK